MLTKIEQAELETAIRDVVEWLGSKQPRDAVVMYHATTFKSKIGPLTVSLLLSATGETATFVFDHEERTRITSGVFSYWPGFSVNDLGLLSTTVSSVSRLSRCWNGNILGPHMIEIAHCIGYGVLHALENYRDGGAEVFRKEWWQAHPVKTTKPKGWA